MFDDKQIIDERQDSEESKVQYILDENKNLIEISKELCTPVEHPIKYTISSAFEVFVRVRDTENYWISNYGRCVNNLNRKNKDTFYEHKKGNVHLTIFEVETCPIRNKRGKLTGEVETVKRKVEYHTDELVAAHFLKNYRGRYKVWHKDGDFNNNWYKNLLYVTPKDYDNLKKGKITWQDLNYEQEYIEYENKATAYAYKIYGGVRARGGDTKDKNYIRSNYDTSTMCQVWWEHPEEFVKWYLEHYYEVDGESMAVDKDLFGDGLGTYSPESCCILPQSLNTMLANCKKHYNEGDSPENMLPLGVRYNSKCKYYGEIAFASTGERRKLSYWNTKEEAFAEYKAMKQADILMMAAKYKGKIPDYIYRKLLTVDVKPY